MVPFISKMDHCDIETENLKVWKVNKEKDQDQEEEKEEVFCNNLLI